MKIFRTVCRVKFEIRVPIKKNLDLSIFSLWSNGRSRIIFPCTTATCLCEPGHKSSDLL